MRVKFNLNQMLAMTETNNKENNVFLQRKPGLLHSKCYYLRYSAKYVNERSVVLT